MPLSSYLAPLFLAYLLGSIPFGLLIARAAGLGDVRAIGSGNIGATNVMRTGRRELGLLTLLCDAGKGAAAVWLAHSFFAINAATLAGLCAVLGHIFPVWLRFKGGKGVATAIGVLLALNPLLGLIVCGFWLATFLFFRISSVASLIAIVYSAIAAYLLHDDATALLCLILALLIVFTHRSNIHRLIAGDEGSFKRKNP